MANVNSPFVFTQPEVAWRCLTEAEAKEKGRAVRVAKFPWSASSRMLTFDRPEGLTKLILDLKTERLLGVGPVAKGAVELISEGALAGGMGRHRASCSFGNTYGGRQPLLRPRPHALAKTKKA